MTMPTIEAVSARLDGLERENRMLRWIAVGLAVALLAVGVAPIFGRDRAGRTLEAQKLVIRDAEGRVRGSFGVDHRGLPALKILDRHGNDQIEMGVPSEDTSSLAFYDRGTLRLQLDASIEGMTSVRLYDPSRVMQSSLVIKRDGAAELSMGDGPRSMTFAFPPDRQPLVITTDSHGRPVERPIATLAALISAAPASLPGDVKPGPWAEPQPRTAGFETGSRPASRGLAN